MIMRIGINCGHTVSGKGCGAVGLINESEHTRLVGYALMELLKEAGVEVVDCTIDSAGTKQEYLEKAVITANTNELDLFISIHFNASASHTGHGVEIYTYKGQAYQEAEAVSRHIAQLGYKNRGIKAGDNLFVIRKTKAKAMLIEVCFCDNRKDVDIYQRTGGYRSIAQAVFNGVCGGGKGEKIQSEAVSETFEEFVGKIAGKDWRERRIVLPSIVVAQAMKESARGTSELAREANALFGIKKNGWTGKTYRKSATEQRKDGSFTTLEHVEWRAYDSFEESILDHNDYIATRSTDGGKTLRFGPVIGCTNYILAAQYLQECGYATAKDYAESLINDYIEKHNLTRFDDVTA